MRGFIRKDCWSWNRFRPFDASRWQTLAQGNGVQRDIKEVEFRWIGAAPHYHALYSESTGLEMDKRDRLHQPYNIIGQLNSNSLLIAADGFRIIEEFDTQALVSKLDSSIEEAQVTDYALLNDL